MSTTYKMTVHEGLSELKILAQRIEKDIRTSTFINVNTHSNTKINGVTVKDYEKQLTAAWQHVNDLIKRRDAIKRAITKSNAITQVSITAPDGTTLTMTVAELIEYKTVGIKYIEMLRNAVTHQYENAMEELRDNNEYLKDRADKYVTGLFAGGKNDTDKNAIEESRATYIKNNTLDLIDPNDSVKIMRELNDKIDFYQTKVDAALSTSNAITMIEFTV